MAQNLFGLIPRSSSQQSLDMCLFFSLVEGHERLLSSWLFLDRERPLPSLFLAFKKNYIYTTKDSAVLFSIPLFCFSSPSLYQFKFLGVSEPESFRSLYQFQNRAIELSMGLTISLFSFAWVEIATNKIASLRKDIEDVIVRSISFNHENTKMTLKSSISFKQNHRDESFKNAAMCSSPRPISELDAAAVKLQKVYKSYRTRRNLADCAVVIEELWWKALDFASLRRSSVSFFDDGKPETAVSRWARARTRAAKVGKGLSKSANAQKLALQHWLEAIDPRHRYGHNLHFYYDVWFKSESTQPFFYWLDIGDGKEVNLEKCPRNTLQNQCIKYLGPNEREAYEVVVKEGKLVYKQSGEFVNTAEGSKWIFVLSTLRALYVGKKKKGKFQHSSFLSGGAISSAGRLVVKHGILKFVWPYSGHYLPTEENFREFIDYLEENGVDLKDVKRCAIDREEYPSFKQINHEPLEIEGKENNIQEDHICADYSDNEKELHPKEPSRNGLKLKLNTKTSHKRLQCQWSTGAGPRIGCVRDYPSNLQSRALEHVNLSPRIIPSPNGNKGPIPSPRPSPGVRLSPRLAYMGFPSPPTISLNLPKLKKT